MATTLGRISAPLSLGTTRAILLRTYATHVFVVPRSIPSTMGFSAIAVLDEFLDGTARRVRGARKARSHLPLYHCTWYRTLAPAALDSTTSPCRGASLARAASDGRATHRR